MRGWTLCELSARLQTGVITAETLVMEYLCRIGASPRRDAYVFLDVEGALVAARASDERRKKGLSLGALDGIPYALEDRFCTKDLPTVNHCEMLRGYRPMYDADVAEQLRAGGAILLGKLATDGFLAGTESFGGADVIAASVAAGEVPFAVSADTGGSGFSRSSVGAITVRYTDRQISRIGLIAVAPSFDGVSTVTSSLEDARFLFDALTHSEKASPDYLNVADLDPSGLCPETARKSYRILSAVEAASEMALYDGIRFGASADEWESVEARVSKTRGSFFSYDEKKVLLLGTALLMDGRREACYLPAREYRETVRKTFEGILERADVIRIPFSEESAFLPGYLGCSALASGGMLLMTSAERSHMLFSAADADGREEGSARA